MRKIVFTTFGGLLCSTSTVFACTLAPVEETQIKAKMAAAIADHIGWEAAQISLDSITSPQLRSPLGLGADCGGLSAMHHSAGFRLEENGCTYEGVAVLMGYGYANPVAVHFDKMCDYANP